MIRMKITIFVEIRKTTPKWHPLIDDYVSSIFYAITKLKIGRKIIPNVTYANVNHIGGADIVFGNKPIHPHSRKQTELELEIDGKNVIYNVLSTNTTHIDNKTFKIEMEVKK